MAGSVQCRRVCSSFYRKLTRERKRQVRIPLLHHGRAEELPFFQEALSFLSAPRADRSYRDTTERQAHQHVRCIIALPYATSSGLYSENARDSAAPEGTLRQAV